MTGAAASFGYCFSAEWGLDMTFDACKSVCMVFAPRDRRSIVSYSFPQFSVGKVKLQYVPRFK